MSEIRSRDISVVIPAYNAEKYIAEAIESIRRQTMGNDARIIVVDDGSQDRTAEIVRGLGVKLISGNHAGTSAARNAGIACVETPWIYLLDADDRAKDHAFCTLADAMGSSAALSGAFGLAEDFISGELTPEQAAQLCPRSGGYSGILPGCSLLKTELFEKVGPFDESLPSGEVVAWMLALRDSGIPVASVDTVVLERRLHMTNTGRLRKADEARGYAALLRKRLQNRG